MEETSDTEHVDYPSIFRIDGLSEDDYANHIFTVDEAKLPDYLREGLMRYMIPQQNDHQHMLQKAFEILQLNPNEFELDELQSKFHRIFHRVLMLYYRFLKMGYLYATEEHGTASRTNFDVCEEYILNFNRLFELLYYWELGLRSIFCAQRVCNPAYDSTQNTDIGLFRFNMIHWKGLCPFQKILLYLLMDLAERGWRKKGDMCMERVHTKDGFDTRTYKPVMKIADYVHKMTSLNTNITQWFNATNNSMNKKRVVEHLSESTDLDFTSINKNRHYFSYPNGIYLSQVWDEALGQHTDRWYFHRNEKEFPTDFLSKEIYSITCCRYFQSDFEIPDEFLRSTDMSRWHEIETPTFHKILKDQHFEEDVCDWMYVLCGRLLHELNDLDEWQVMPFLLGKAGTGKSTIINKVVKLFFDAEDVKVISNSIEQQFGIWPLLDGFIWIAPEISEHCKIDQCTLQSMVSGEALCVAKKHEKAETIAQFKNGGMGGGNKFFGFQDNQGSIGRRFVIFCFEHLVPKADTKLGDKLEREVPYLLIKCNRAYLDAVNKYGNKGLWTDDVLPKYFLETRRQVAETTNSFVSFLNQSDQLEYGPKDTHYIQVRRFKELYKQFCEENHFAKLSLSREVINVPLEMKGLKWTATAKCMEDPMDRRKHKVRWLLGVRQCKEDSYEPGGTLNSEAEEDFE